MKHTYTKKEDLRIIITTAKEYAKMLEDLNLKIKPSAEDKEHIQS